MRNAPVSFEYYGMYFSDSANLDMVRWIGYDYFILTIRTRVGKQSGMALATGISDTPAASAVPLTNAITRIKQ